MADENTTITSEQVQPEFIFGFRGKNRSKFKNLVGMKFSRLTVVSYFGRLGKHGEIAWSCRCDCGNTSVVRSQSLVSGRIKSCGCLRGISVHGDRKSSAFNCHVGIIQRCTNPKNPEWKDYGGRGITICDAWRNSFKTFEKDMGPRPVGLQVERIDNNGNYEPGNCKWGTPFEQCRNKRDNVFIEFNGKRQCLTDWSRESGVPRETLRTRILRGIPFGDALKCGPNGSNRGSNFITFGGETKTIPQWAKQYDISPTTLVYRIKNGVPVSDALNTKRFKRGEVKKQ